MAVHGRARTGPSGQRDPQSGRNLYFLRARFYDPQTGRFLGRDPARAGHPYGYAGNNPVNFVDPSGLHCRAWHLHHRVPELPGPLECILISPLFCADDAAAAFADVAGDAFCKEGGFGCLDDAFEEIGDFLGNFATLECLTAAITIAGVATGGWGVAVSTAVNVGINAAAGDGGGVARETLGTSPEAGTAWLKNMLQYDRAYGNIVVPGGGQPMITTVRNLKVGGNAAFALVSVYQCVDSGL